MKSLLLIPALLLVVTTFQGCNLSGSIITSGSPTKLAFTSSNTSDTGSPGSTQQPKSNLKPCGSSLAPGESCSLQVQFTPSASGSRTGSLQIRSGGEVLEEVALSGQGE